MSSPPPISVLLPVRNGAEYLPEAIASIEAQTYSKYEVIAVDDGSSDDSWFVLQEWASRDERVKVFRQGPDGIVPAGKHGCTACNASSLSRPRMGSPPGSLLSRT